MPRFKTRLLAFLSTGWALLPWAALSLLAVFSFNFLKYLIVPFQGYWTVFKFIKSGQQAKREGNQTEECKQYCHVIV